MFNSTDKVTPHQFGAFCGEGMIFVFRFENTISNQDSAALAHQIQALVATIEELTKQNQEMKLGLQQEEH